jgi:hypothetical protein
MMVLHLLVDSVRNQQWLMLLNFEAVVYFQSMHYCHNQLYLNMAKHVHKYRAANE